MKSETQYLYLLIMLRNMMEFGGTVLMNIQNLPWTIVSKSAIEKYIDGVKSWRYVRSQMLTQTKSTSTC